MSISVTGLGSGLEYDSWIEQLVAIKQKKIDAVSSQATLTGKKQTTLSSIKSNYQSLLDSIKSFTNSVSTDDVFKQKKVTSSSSAITAKVDANATAQDIKVSVSQLATATTAKSATPVASYVDGSTLMSDVSKGAFKAGTFSLYVGGNKSSINISANEDMDSVLTKLNGIEGVSAGLTNGKLSIAAKDGYTLGSVGSSSDTSNFSNLMSLTRNASTGAYSSSKAIFDTDTSDALVSANYANGAITAGKFTIGDKTFTVDSSKSLDSIIKEINDSECGATASWDANLGKLVLSSVDQGAVSINVTAGTGTAGETDASNFTDIMGLTNSVWTDGELTSTALASNSQSLGTNAILTINGTEITSSSNTVTSDISGVPGLTLTLNSKTTDDTNVAVSSDTTAAINAITSFVSAFNMSISATDKATSKDGELHGESILSSLRSTVRQTVTASASVDGAYKTLASIGISTGAFTTDTSADTNKLNIDTEKLTKALTEDPESVKKLLIGDGVHDGVMSKMTPSLNNSLNAATGYFAKRDTAYGKEISKLNEKVSKMDDARDRYEAQMKAKFESMDKLISSLKSSASVFDSYFNKDTTSSK